MARAELHIYWDVSRDSLGAPVVDSSSKRSASWCAIGACWATNADVMTLEAATQRLTGRHFTARTFDTRPDLRAKMFDLAIAEMEKSG